MSDFNVQIKVDPGSAIPTIKAFDGALASAEIKANALERASIAVGRGMGGMGQQARADVSALTSVGTAFAGLASQMEREAAVLERIRRPQREYMADLGALDMLLERNTISTKEYAEQVARLNEGIEKTPKGGAEGGGHESVTAFAGGMIAEGALTEAAHTLAEMVEESEQLKDKWIEATNAAQKFTDAGHSVNTVVADQIQLAHDLHSKLDITMELYDKVRDGTDEMNLSYEEQIRLTKTLGESTTIAGNAGKRALESLSFMFANNVADVGTVSAVMKKVPEIADLWTKSFGVSRTQFIEMVRSHKIGAEEIANSMAKAGVGVEDLDKKFAKLERTNEQIKSEIIENAKLTMGNTGQNFAGALATNAFHDAGYRDAKEQEQEETERFQSLIKNISEARGQWRFLNDVVVAGRGVFADTLGSIPGMLDKIQFKLSEVTAGFRAQLGITSEVGDEFGRKLKLGMDASAKVGDAKIQLVALKAALADGSISAVQFRTDYDALMTTLNGGRLPETIKMLEAIRDPIDEYARATRALNFLVDKGTITLAQYNEELAKLIAAAPKAALGINTDNLTRRVAHRQGYDPQLDVDTSTSTSFAESGFTEAEKLDNDARNKMVKDAEEAKKRLASEEARINTDKWKAEIEGYRKHQEEMVSALKPLEDGILQFAETGKGSVEDMVDSWIKSLEAAELHKAIEGIAGLLTSALFGGGGGGPLDVIENGQHTGIPLFGGAHATGGSYDVPGSGGPDSQNVMFRLTPGEHVQFTPPGQMQSAPMASGGGGRPSVHIQLQDDRTALLQTMDSRDGDRLVARINRRTRRKG